MKFAVDKIIDNICILENISTGELVEVNVSVLPMGIKEKNILVYADDKYMLDFETENERRKSLRERLERLKKLNR